MKRIKIIPLVVTLLVLVLVFMFTGSVFANTEVIIEGDINKVAGVLHVPKYEVVNGNVTMNLGELTIDGIVNGDVSSNMGQIVITGDVNGNVETNMGQIIIDGNVSGDVKTRMGELIVDGSVGGNINADLGSTEISGTVGGDIGSGLGELVINGVVSGHINSRGGMVVINGIVEGDIYVKTGLVELKPGAIVSGKVEVGRGNVIKAETATVGGVVNINEFVDISDLDKEDRADYYVVDGDYIEDTVENIIERVMVTIDKALDEENIFPKRFQPARYFFQINPFNIFYINAAQGVINMLILFALAALVYTLFPNHIKTSREALTSRLSLVIGWGALALILAVPIMFVLTITIIGIPLILLQVLLYFGALIFGYTCIAGYTGERIVETASSKETNPFAALALGVLLFGLICMIPILGGIVGLALFIFSVGIALATRFGTIKPTGIDESEEVSQVPEK